MDIGKILSKKYGDMYHGSSAPKLLKLSTGYIGFDVILGGGLPIGRMVQLAAPPSVGKSTTSICISKNLLEDGHPVLYLDLERTCDEDRLRHLGVAGHELFHYLRPDDGEVALTAAIEAVALGVRLVVIDSVPNLIPSSVMENDIGKLTYSPVAKFLGNEYPKLVSAFERYNACLILINQVRDNIGSMYGGKSHPGGYALKHALSVSIDMSRVGEVKDNSAYNILFKTSKNKVYKEKLITELAYYKDSPSPICKYSSILHEGVKCGVIVQAGAYFKLSTDIVESMGFKETLGQGKERAQQSLADDKVMYEYLYNKILELNGIN
jgi:recombination protein RecA